MKISIFTTVVTILFAVSGCHKTSDPSTAYYSYFENKTNHKVVVTPYLSGVVYPQNISTLSANENLLLIKGGVLGTTEFTPLTAYIGVGSQMDSTIVTFDDTLSIVHYLMASPIGSRKYYLWTSNRNLLNRASWNEEIDKSHASWKVTTRYTFTEQDYLDAK